jgi:hypothetical protein
VNFEGPPAGGRLCDLGKFGIAEEEIIHYHQAQKEITWSAKNDKLPGFLKELQNALKVEKIDEKSCRVTTNLTANTTGIGGFFLSGPIKANFTKLLKGFVKDWKAYVETGEVSATKKRREKD